MSEIFDQLMEFQNIQIRTAERARDNVFDADHRSKMLSEYGYTEAGGIQVQFNKATGKAEIV